MRGESFKIVAEKWDLNIFDKHILENGIMNIWAYSDEKEEEKWEDTINKFLQNTEKDKDLRKLVFRILDFLIWIKKHPASQKIKITSRKHQKKLSLELSYFVNRIIKNTELNEGDRLHILTILYCHVMECFKNIVEKEIFLKILKEIDEIDNKKNPKIELFGFLKILGYFEGKDKLLTPLFNRELRNSINHSDYFIEDKKLKYFDKGKQIGYFTEQKFNEILPRLGVCLQFFVGFYLRLFRASDDIKEIKIIEESLE